MKVLKIVLITGLFLLVHFRVIGQPLPVWNNSTQKTIPGD
jgi:hypothetical protein